jgi:indole-3-glycerol phosphate synthase
MGDINLTVDITEQASQYEAAGAAMISVLTDQIFFKGMYSFFVKSQIWFQFRH